MEKIVRGIRQFQQKAFSEHQELFERLAGGQSPETLFITCSDSRINPHLLTQTQPGELFIIRNAGNIVPPWGAANGGEGATIEYAVKALGVKDAIVCGHTHCGAMAGLLKPESLSSLPAVKRWLEHADATASVIASRESNESGEDLLTSTVKQNVLCQIANLRTHPSVAAAVAKGELKLHGWVYQFETGDVHAFDPQEGKFLAVRDLPDDQLGAVGARTV